MDVLLKELFDDVCRLIADIHSMIVEVETEFEMVLKKEKELETWIIEFMKEVL